MSKGKRKYVSRCSCVICKKEFSNAGLATHILRTHENDSRFENSGHKTGDPNFKGGNQYTKARDLNLPKPELTQKTKETLRRLRQERNKTKEHRDAVSISMRRYFENNPSEIPYRKYHHSKGRSYPEKLFAEELSNRKITGWVQEFQHSIYTYDIAFPELKIDIEIDGNTHLQPAVRNSDDRRDEWSRSKGWAVIRFTAGRVNKQVKQCVDELLVIINQSSGV